MTLRDLWAWVTTGQRRIPNHIDPYQLTVTYPTRLTEIEQRQAADAEAKILRVSGRRDDYGRVIRPVVGKRIPAVTTRQDQ